MDFIKRNGPQWKRDLIRRLRGRNESETVLDRPLRKAREKGKLTTLPRPPVGPHVDRTPVSSSTSPEPQARCLEANRSRLDRLKGLKEVGIERRMIPDLNDDVYWAWFRLPAARGHIESARFQIEVLGDDGTIHRQSGLWDYDDCVPPNPTELPFAVGESHD